MHVALWMRLHGKHKFFPHSHRTSKAAGSEVRCGQCTFDQRDGNLTERAARQSGGPSQPRTSLASSSQVELARDRRVYGTGLSGAGSPDTSGSGAVVPPTFARRRLSISAFFSTHNRVMFLCSLVIGRRKFPKG